MKELTNKELLEWIISNLLTDSQLNVVPTGQTISLRFLKIK